MKQMGCVLALLVMVAVSSPAATLTFVATGPVAPGLSPLNENPAHPESHGTGTALITWDKHHDGKCRFQWVDYGNHGCAYPLLHQPTG